MSDDRKPRAEPPALHLCASTTDSEITSADGRRVVYGCHQDPDSGMWVPSIAIELAGFNGGRRVCIGPPSRHRATRADAMQQAEWMAHEWERWLTQNLPVPFRSVIDK